MSPSLLPHPAKLAAACLVALSAWSGAAPQENVSHKAFGKTEAGEAVELYTLKNGHGLEVSIMTYGATVVDLRVPDRAGHLADVSLGFDTLEPYLTKSPYFGAIVGRYGNRIAAGRFTLEGRTHQLATNDGPNHLHGGKLGFDKRVWSAEIAEQEPASVRFHRTSPDGEEGYPGQVQIGVTYTLTEKNELKIAYTGNTEAPTVFNPTNHTYFNLAGEGKGTILNHQLRLVAGHYTPVNSTLIPTGEIKAVEGTPMDFRRAEAIGSRLQQVGGKPVGYDHNWVLEAPTAPGLRQAAEVYEPESGRVMEVLTDQPGIQFYSGNFLDGTIHGKGGKVYPQYSGFCLETQHYPDSPNQPSFPSTELRPGQTYESTTVYRFSTR